MRYRVDLHTHSIGSPDGGLKTADYRKAIYSGQLDYIAITDHGSIGMALQIRQELGELGKRIIIGQEVMTDEGEIIGLYLKKTIADRMTLKKTVQEIQSQGGLVYVPHPFETVRSGLSLEGLAKVRKHVDIMEVSNGRAVVQNRGRLARQWAEQHKIAGAASSDAHGRRGWGRTYSVIRDQPTRQNLVAQLMGGKKRRGKVGVGVLYPKANRIRKAVKRGSAA